MNRALFFAALALASSSAFAVDTLLDNARGFRPAILFTDGLSEKVIRTSVTDATTGVVTETREVVAHTKVHVQVVASLKGVDISEFNEDTVIGITIGNFTHRSRLGGDPEYEAGDKRATFRMTEVVNEDGTAVDDGGGDGNGQPGNDGATPAQQQKVLRKGRVSYGWNSGYFLVLISGKDIGDIVSAEHRADADDERVNGRASVRFKDSMDCTVSIGEHTGTRKVYSKGVTAVVDRVFFNDPKVAGASPTDETLSVHRVLANGSLDKTPPRIFIDIPRFGSQGFAFGGSIADGNEKPTIDRIFARRLDDPSEPAIDAGAEEVEYEDVTEDGRFRGWGSFQPLSDGGVYFVRVFARDESGNTSSAERTVTLQPAPDAPTNVTLTTGTATGTIIVSYDPVPGAKQYVIEVQRSTDTSFRRGDVTIRTTETVGETSTVDSSDITLTSGQSVKVRVKVIGQDGQESAPDTELGQSVVVK